MPDPAVGMISRKAGGSFRDALGTLEQLVTYGSFGDRTRGRAGQPRRGRRRADTRQRRSPDREVPEGRAAHRGRGWPTRVATTSSSCATSRPTCAICWWSRPWARCRTRSPSRQSTPIAWPPKAGRLTRVTCCGHRPARGRDRSRARGLGAAAGLGGGAAEGHSAAGGPVSPGADVPDRPAGGPAGSQRRPGRRRRAGPPVAGRRRPARPSPQRRDILRPRPRPTRRVPRAEQEGRRRAASSPSLCGPR